MRVKRVILPPEIEDKLLQKHSVLAEEVDEVLFGNPLIYFVEKGHREGENLYAAYGQTESGRYLVVFFILKRNAHTFVISARDMDPKEKRHYGKQKR